MPMLKARGVRADAWSLFSALVRNTILSLAEGELFRMRWSEEILDQTESALAGMLAMRGVDAPKALVARKIKVMCKVFPGVGRAKQKRRAI